MNVTNIRSKAENKQVFPSVSVETSLLIDHILKNRNSGQTISYSILSAVIGRDILANRGFLHSAARILFRDHGIFIETVRRVGVRIGDNVAVLDAGIRDVSSSRRALKRASRKFDSVEYSKLPEDKQKEYVGHVSAVNTLRLLTKPSAVRKIAEAGSGEPLPSASVLDLFRK